MAQLVASVSGVVLGRVAYAQSDQSLCLSHEYSMTLELLTEHDLEFLSLKGDCTCSSEYSLINMPHCWKSHVAAHICLLNMTFMLANSPFRKPHLLLLFSLFVGLCQVPS